MPQTYYDLKKFHILLFSFADVSVKTEQFKDFCAYIDERVWICVLIFTVYLGATRVERNMRHPQSTFKMSAFTNPCATPLNYTPPAGLINFEVAKLTVPDHTHPSSVKWYKNSIKQ